MNDLPPLVYPEYYHRPVAHMSDVEWFQQRTAEVLNSCSMEELQSHTDKVLVLDQTKPYVQHPTFDTIEALDRYVEYHDALRNETSARKRRRMSRGHHEPLKYMQIFRCVLGYSWHAHEGSRYPERFEPEYLSLAITSSGLYRQIYSPRHGGAFLMKHRSFNKQELVAIWIATN